MSGKFVTLKLLEQMEHYVEMGQFVSYVVVCVLYGYFGRYYERVVGRGGDSDNFKDEEEGDEEEGTQFASGLCRSFQIWGL